MVFTARRDRSGHAGRLPGPPSSLGAPDENEIRFHFATVTGMSAIATAPLDVPSACATESRDGAISLSDLAPGARARVVSVEGEGPEGERLLDLGFIPGTAIAVVKRAPLRDPVIYELRGYRICLRRSEAARIRVISE